MKLKFKKLKEEAILPSYAHPGDAGFDLYSIENYVLKSGERHIFKIGLASQIPSEYCVFFKPKSGLAAKKGIDVLAGVIDSSYRGEWGVVLINLGQKEVEIKKGDKIAQGVLMTIGQAEIVETSVLSTSKRGQNAFGSTGR